MSRQKWASYMLIRLLNHASYICKIVALSSSVPLQFMKQIHLRMLCGEQQFEEDNNRLLIPICTKLVSHYNLPIFTYRPIPKQPAVTSAYHAELLSIRATLLIVHSLPRQQNQVVIAWQLCRLLMTQNQISHRFLGSCVGLICISKAKIWPECECSRMKLARQMMDQLSIG